MGGAIITPVLALVVTALGWRWGAFLAGTLFLVVGLPLCIGVRRSPESIGMAPEGKPLQAAQNTGGPSKDPTGQYEEADITCSESGGTRHSPPLKQPSTESLVCPCLSVSTHGLEPKFQLIFGLFNVCKSYFL